MSQTPPRGGSARSISSRRLLVTGASSGIGRAVAQEALDRGAAVAGLGRRRGRLEDVSGLVPVVADVTEPERTAYEVEAAIDELGGLDGLVNAAGMNRPGLVSETHHDDWRIVFDTNVLGLLTVTRAAMPALRAGVDSVIMNVSSMSAHRVLSPANGVYAASKAAVSALSDALRLELDGEVRVVEVAPGYVRDTEIHRDYAPAHRREADERQQEHGVDRADFARLLVDLIAQPAGVEVNALTVTRPGYGRMGAYHT